MTQRIWDTRGPLAPEFAEAWYARLARCPHAVSYTHLTLPTILRV